MVAFIFDLICRALSKFLYKFEKKKTLSVPKETTSKSSFFYGVTPQKLNLMFGCVRSVSLSLDTSTDLLLSISNLRLLLKFWSDLTMIEENEFEGGKESCSAHSICSEGSSFLNPFSLSRLLMV